MCPHTYDVAFAPRFSLLSPPASLRVSRHLQTAFQTFFCFCIGAAEFPTVVLLNDLEWCVQMFLLFLSSVWNFLNADIYVKMFIQVK